MPTPDRGWIAGPDVADPASAGRLWPDLGRVYRFFAGARPGPCDMLIDSVADLPAALEKLGRG
jgi:hypothetical protein